MPSDNSSLGAAKEAKHDEYYTRLTDIEKELRHYRRHFKGRVVLCNCDDPFESNFFKYFVLNFNKLGLKKLVATCYAGSPITGTRLNPFGGAEEKPPNTPYKAVVTVVRDATGDGGIDMLDVAELFRTGENELTELDGDGDFRSPECLALLDEADVVCTNPPFSLFREFVVTLVEYSKKFVIIGHNNGRKYAETFPLVKANRLWLGMTHPRRFYVPDSYESEAVRVDDEGRRYMQMGNISWYTNLDVSIRQFDTRDVAVAYERQGGRCAICGKSFDLSKMHADHITPWSKGGHSTLKNLQMLCRDCHLKKGAQG